MKNLFNLAVVFLFILAINTLSAQTNSKNEYKTPESVVRAVFDFCSFEGGKEPVYEKIKDLVIEKGIMVLKAGGPGFEIVNRDEFVNLWKRDMPKLMADKIGYDDKLIKIKTIEYGDIAASFVYFESKLTGVNFPPKIGLNIFNLIKKDGRWWVAAVTEEVVSAKNPIPESLFK